MATVDELVLRIRTEGAQAIQGMQRRLGGLVNVAGQAATAIAAVGTATVATALKVSEAADADIKRARALGLTTERWQELSTALDRAGVSESNAETGIRRLSRFVDEVRQGTKEYTDVSDRLGLTQKIQRGELNEMGTALGEVLSALRDNVDESERLALAQEVLGRSGSRFGTAIEGGAEGLEEATRRARVFGFIIKEGPSKAAETLNDNLADLRDVAAGFVRQGVVRLIPVLRDVSVALTDWWEVNGALIRQRFDRFLSSVGRFAEIAVGPLGQFFGIFGAVGLALNIKRIAVALGGFAQSLPLIGPALTKIAPMIPTLARFGGALALVALAAEDVLVFSRGGDSLIGRVLRALGGEEAESEGRRALTSLTRAFRDLGTALGDIAEAAGFGPALGDFFDALTSPDIGKIEGLASVLGSLADALDRIAGSFRDVSSAVALGATGTEASAIGAESFLGALQESGLGGRSLAGIPGVGGLAALGLLAPAARDRLDSASMGTGQRLRADAFGPISVTINGSPRLTREEIESRFQATANEIAAETENNE